MRTLPAWLPAGRQPRIRTTKTQRHKGTEDTETQSEVAGGMWEVECGMWEVGCGKWDVAGGGWQAHPNGVVEHRQGFTTPGSEKG